ncbi:TylF/MycF/NovP-related O-methyltransferase [Brytella acorum]|uniref:Class I SAM-dependent methyltransferase n=2 Tax=Brytella acorum TaxID=2959299 RepID=A0AA35VBA1_9PROT|nr:TylF/MycF/NovP-related O-methyltransferase [Brytella acorum]CAI9121126.1 class I SAM-dependent methyltransferase [Brytella acorum]
MWMRNEKLRRFIGGNSLARSLTCGLQNRLQMSLLAGHKKPVTIERLRDATRRSASLLSSDEAFMLHEFAQAQAALPGVMAEFGVYQGASAAVLCAAKGSRPLHLFDTFEGLPEPSTKDGKVFSSGQFKGTLPRVKNALRGYTDVHYHRGIFPETAHGLEDLRFSFVHLDVDLHDATLAGLEFFYPRMVPGGIILTHDHSIIEGVARAFSEFFGDKPERVIELATTQAMVIRSAPAEAGKLREQQPWMPGIVNGGRAA